MQSDVFFTHPEIQLEEIDDVETKKNYSQEAFEKRSIFPFLSSCIELKITQCDRPKLYIRSVKMHVIEVIAGLSSV